MVPPLNGEQINSVAQGPINPFSQIPGVTPPSTTQLVAALLEDIRMVQEDRFRVAEDIKSTQKLVIKVGDQIDQAELDLSNATTKEEKRRYTFKLHRLVDKEKALMDKEKALMDEKKALVDKVTSQGSGVSRSSPAYAILRGGVQHDRVLRFEGDPFAESSAPKELFVRQTWEKMYDAIMGQIDSGIKSIVVTGSPGVGKSEFSLYFMWRWSQSNRPFLHENVPGLIECYLPSGDVATHARTNSLRKDIPYFVDLKSLDLPFWTSFWDPLFTIVFSSPNPLRFKEFLKKPKSVRLVMPPWSLEDILAAREAITAFQSLNETVVLEQFNLYGGIPRYVLEKALEGGSRMEEAIDQKGLAIASQVFLIPMGSGDENDISHTLAHMFPEKDNFTGYKYRPASQYVARRLITLHGEIFRTKMKEMVKFGRDRSGEMWELLVSIDLLPNKSHAISRLSPTSSTPALANASDNELMVVGECQQLPSCWKDGAWRPTPEVFYAQRVSNMESVDGLMLTRDHTLVFFQVTTAKAHGVKVKGLRDVYEQFQDVAESCKLVFVVPSVSEIVSVQPLETQTGTKWRGTNLITPIERLVNEQFVLRFDLDDGRVKP